MNMQWKCFELHSHTLNSDGDFTLEELRAHARDFLYDGIALTDHNTMSALDPRGDALPPGIPVIPGLEWTTFYGHLLVIGAEKYVDWRLARIDTIDQYTREIKAARGAVGIAHPFALGSPICTGCRWDFKVRDWRHIDYVEVWSNPFPQRHLKNTLAFEWWTGLLNQGHRLGASAGWDWHRMPRDKPLPAATWLALEGGIINTGTVREALSAGRTIVTCGPLPEILLRRGDRLFYPGDSLDRGPANIRVTLDEGRRREIWGSFGIRCTRIALVQNGKTVQSFPPGENGPPEPELDLAPGWLRVEGYGDLQNEGGKLLFFTSPYYIL